MFRGATLAAVTDRDRAEHGEEKDERELGKVGG